MILSNSSLTMFQRTVRSWASTNHQHFVVGGAVVRRSIMGGVLAVCSGDQHNDRNVLSWSERALKNNTQALSPAVLQASQERGQAQAPAQQLHQLEQRRYRHSKRQIRRLFKGPRRAYLDRLAGIDRSPKPPPAVEYLPVFTPEKVLPNGWSSPPPPTFERPEYPFTVKRTRNKPHGAVGFLPIYSKFRYVVVCLFVCFFLESPFIVPWFPRLETQETTRRGCAAPILMMELSHSFPTPCAIVTANLSFNQQLTCFFSSSLFFLFWPFGYFLLLLLHSGPFLLLLRLLLVHIAAKTVQNAQR